MAEKSAVHKYGDATKTSCMFVGIGLLTLVLTIALTNDGSPFRWLGKGAACIPVLYAAYIIGGSTYTLASDSHARQSPGVLRNIAVSVFLCLVLAGLVVSVLT
jgi:hypothetical protein